MKKYEIKWKVERRGKEGIRYERQERASEERGKEREGKYRKRRGIQVKEGRISKNGRRDTKHVRGV